MNLKQIKKLSNKELAKLTKINIKYVQKKRKFIEQILLLPKVDLHLHIGGSLRVKTIIELAKEQNFELPTYDENKLRKICSKDKYKDLPEYLKVFSEITEPLLQEKESLARAAYELAVDLAEENVVYFELRFAPMNYTHKGLRPYEIVKAVNAGLEKAEKEKGIKSGMILCAVRIFKKHISPYHKKIYKYFSSFTPKQLAQEVARNTAVLAINSRKVDGIERVSGFDIAGPEKGFQAKNFVEAYRLIKKAGMYSTCHAGEDHGWQSIKQAIVDCGVDRIGHGTKLLTNKTLLEYCKGMKRIPVEVCVTSNVQTCSNIRDYKTHPVKKFIENNVRICLCQDNRLVSNTTKTKEDFLTAYHHNLDIYKLMEIELNALKSGFIKSDDREKLINDFLKTVKKYKFYKS